MATYQAGKDAGRSCVPEKAATSDSVFRATNYPVGAVNPNNPRQVVVTFGSYINAHSNEANGCIPDGFTPGPIAHPMYRGVKTPGACSRCRRPPSSPGSSSATIPAEVARRPGRAPGPGFVARGRSCTTPPRSTG